ncbi:phosphoprotein ECPP44-like [Cryptomeria japonica]|uniref:phosphoprotein ECPP44-like n=1 Tax=Cryptomeria japonica TaxID=3369 RepID=UPI0027DA91DF|nr:phosphoprotein ECPP44-like [Cryptomeria japonica]XP_059074723.1 phosphoprotein ECPP44-like [Cryptomeria japonica]
MRESIKIVGCSACLGRRKKRRHVAGVATYEQGHVGEIHPTPMSHGHVEEGKVHGEGEGKKNEGGLMEKLHRTNNSSSSSISCALNLFKSSDEEEDGKGEKKKKKKVD